MARQRRRSLTKRADVSTLDSVSEPFTISKVAEEERLVFGFANVAFSTDGRQITDLQGDLIDVDDLEKAAYAFMLEHQSAGEMHRGEPVGRVIESVVFTPEKLTAMGLVATDVKKAYTGRWWIGVKLAPEAFAKVKSGQYRMFSIQGSAHRIPQE